MKPLPGRPMPRIPFWLGCILFYLGLYACAASLGPRTYRTVDDPCNLHWDPTLQRNICD